MDILDARSDTYLSWARSKDIEVYREAEEAGLLRKTKYRPKSFEMDTATQILAGIYFLMQQNVHVASHSKKRFRGEPWPTPETAAEIAKREDADRGYDELMAEIVYLEQDEFDAYIAAHAAQDAFVLRPPE